MKSYTWTCSDREEMDEGGSLAGHAATLCGHATRPCDDAGNGARVGIIGTLRERYLSIPSLRVVIERSDIARTAIS